MKRTIFIGDVHGCLNELIVLIKLLDVGKKDRVIILGDIVSKGPKSLETIKYIYKNKYECLMGNNDYYFIKKKNHYLRNNLTTCEINWFYNLPFYIKENNFIAVHAGIHPEYTLETIPNHILLSLRYIDGHPWYYYYSGNIPIFYGHWAQQGLMLNPNSITPLTIGLDSGCVYGKKLSSYTFETQKLIQVKAFKTYQTIPSNKCFQDD